jgi:hypothetical protein
MNASQPVRSPLQAVELRHPRRTSRPASTSSEPLKPTDRTVALESSFKLVVNLVISGIAVSALVHLIPFHQSGKTKLQQLEMEVQTTEARVDRLREQFTMSFDPKQTKTIMQQESNLTDPTQMRVIFKDSEASNK